MTATNYSALFSPQALATLFPADRADLFFDALFGDAAEGAYDINLQFTGHTPADNTLNFAFNLEERPGKCLACNLTYGLPEVFSRHPMINVKGLVAEIDTLLGDDTQCAGWRLGTTQSVSKALHVIPLIITLSA